MLLRLDSCVRRNDEGLSEATEPKFWDFVENDAVFCIMRHSPQRGKLILVPTLLRRNAYQATIFEFETTTQQ